MGLLPLVDKKEAWKRFPEERSVGIDKKRFPYRFRRRWFELRNQCTFSTFLLDRFPPNQPHKMLTIGVFEGYQEVWLMQHILCHPESQLFCIDPWAATTKLDQVFMDQCKENTHHNLSEWIRQNKVHLTRGYSQDVMGHAIEQELYQHTGGFDLIIIDGDHNADPVYQDAINSLSLVKPGGWLLFDDVRNQTPKKDHVWQGLERFLTDYGDQVKHVWSHRFCDCYEKL